jgi:sugar/nucleoside kinase (ribokinase family)
MIAATPLKSFHAVAVVGSVTIDRNVCDDRTLLKVGGVPTYAGLTYRRHALSTWAVCNVAPADVAILSPLRMAGIQIVTGETQRTTRFVNRLRADRRTQHMPSFAAPIRHGQVAAVSGSVDCIHLGPLHPDDIEANVFERLNAGDALVVLDLQGLTRRSDRGRIVPAPARHLAAALRAASIVKTEQRELGVILDAFDGGITTLMERFNLAEWVVTSGAQGGCIHVRGGRQYFYPAAPVDTAADPTGAGDVFLAAYTVARFRRRRSVPAAARQAARLSAAHIAGRYLSGARLDLRPAVAPEKPAARDIDNKVNDV